MTSHHPLLSLSPLDGRYHKQCGALAEHFCEKSLIWHRLFVEISWLKTLADMPHIPECPALPKALSDALTYLLHNFHTDDATRIKMIEKEVSHDVKAIEIFLSQQAFEGWATYVPWLHFACTSEDINNLAYALMTQSAIQKTIRPRLMTLLDTLCELAKQHIDTPMLARTHGQPATPTTVGRELAVFVRRLAMAIQHLDAVNIEGKFNGATGGFNAHIIAYPNVDWLACSEAFVKGLGLMWNPVTTQIEPHDHIGQLMHRCIEINTILMDLSTDIWQYISHNHFKLAKNSTKQVGSSTMPHKVNPIQFENAEGNLGISIALQQHLAVKLSQSRLQRDLSDSTVMRNIGVALAYADMAHQQLHDGLHKITPNEDSLKKELDAHWEILGEAIQTILRKHGHVDAYNTIRELTQGQKLNANLYKKLIEDLFLPDDDASVLRNLTPSSYAGADTEILNEALSMVNLCQRD